MDSKSAPISLPDSAVPGKALLRRRLLIRLCIFLALELAFVALAIVCLNNPLPCSVSSSPALAKGAFTALFIVWQAFAITCAQEIVLHGFSSEWYFRFRETGKLSPGNTDIVSTVTSGLPDKVRHFFSRTSSPPYRFSFVTSLVLVALAGIAPGSMNVDIVPHSILTTVNITNFTLTGGDTNSLLLNPIIWAGLITELELRESSPFKFATEDGAIVGWPNVNVGQLVGDLEFKSDIVLYDMKCWWEAPTVNSSHWNTTWYAGGYAWYPWMTPFPSTVFDGGMMPMFRFSTGEEFIPHRFPNPLPAVDPVGLSGYIFFGRNSSFPQIPSARKNLNLDGIPTTFNETGFHFINFAGDDGYFRSPLVTFLVCDPQARILDGQVLLSQENLSITVQSTTPIAQSGPKIGNISPDAANVVLGLGQMSTLECGDEAALMRIGALASLTFLNDTSLDFDPDPSNPFDVGFLSIEDIQQNLQLAMKSGAKGFSSYMRDYTVEHSDTLFLMPAPGISHRNEPALVTSRYLLISTTFLFVIAAVLILINFFYFNIWQTPSFKLESLVDHVTKYQQENEKLLLTHEPSSGSAPPHLRTFVIQLFSFVVMEAAFLGLVLACANEPIIVGIPLPSAEVKGGFTVLFIIWQALAIFLLSEASTLAFSGEWSLQFAKTGRLIPGVTDRVSRLTSGNDDKMRFFFAKVPSVTFRVAFIVSLVLTALNSVAPGSLSVSGIMVPVESPLDITDLRLLNASLARENSNNLNFLLTRADTLVTMEQYEDSNFKYDLRPNWVTAWPDEMSIESRVVGTMEYPTDVVHFNYVCSWRVPKVGFQNGTTTWVVDDQAWVVWGAPIPKLQYRGGIIPLHRDMDVQPDGRSAYLFIGTNDSFPVDSVETKRSVVSLNNVPTLVHPAGLQINKTGSIVTQWLSPLSTILLCDPNLSISGGRAQLSPNSQLIVSASRLPPVGNMPIDAVKTIFTQAMLNTLDTDDDTNVVYLGLQSVRVFLTDTSSNFTGFPRGVSVLDLSIVNNNLNKYTLSASKAFTDGFYVSPTNRSDITPQTRTVVGLGEVEKPALNGAKSLGIVSLCLSIGAMVGFGVLILLLNKNPGSTFELRNIMRALRERDL